MSNDAPALKRARISVDRVTPTASEAALFATLLRVAHSITPVPVLRVAGGWVRDKLLGRNSDDIDIALDSLFGTEFVSHAQEVLGDALSGIGVIAANAAQSKHLETATFVLQGFSLDVNNLRTEVYEEDSRIPTMKLGTPVEDAHRRDFTINAMYYNVNEGKVEDFTGKGMEDLRLGVIRTPLPPKQTFMDDPLRVLRALRFASRFQFELADDLKLAAQDAEVIDSLLNKVSRERYGIEVKKIMENRSSNPLQAVRWMVEFGLFDAVFLLPADVPADAARVQAGVTLMETLWTQRGSVEALLGTSIANLDSETLRYLWFAAALHPLQAIETRDTKKSKPMSASQHVLLNALKLAKSDATSVDTILQGANDMYAAVSAFPEWTEADQFAVASSMRNTCKSLWRVSLALAALLDADNAAERVDRAAEIARWVVDSGRDECWTWRPRVGGKDLAREFGVKGREIGVLVGKQMDLLLRQPELTAEEIVALLREERGS